MRPGEELTLAVLAGGAGARLGGVHKPLLLRQGRPLVAHLLEALGRKDALIVTRTPGLYARFGARVVTDRQPEGGPLSGLQAALEESRTEWVALVAGDMPGVRPEAIELLVAAAGPTDQWVVFGPPGRLEPFPGLYRRSLLGRLPGLLAEGAGLQKLLRATPGREVDQAMLARVDPALESLASINTPEDAERWEVALPSTQP
jgi:molybdopterin-guanine dinucleotide biosynthesis protein A